MLQAWETLEELQMALAMQPQFILPQYLQLHETSLVLRHTC